MLKIKNILLFVFATVFQLSAQVGDNNLPKEILRVNVSQELLFPGDVVWLSVFCINSFDDHRELSKLVFVELINEKNASVVRKKINLLNRTGNSYIELPDSLSTGVYTILAYTNWMKNFGEEYFSQTQIAIVNPTKPYTEKGDVQDRNTDSEKPIAVNIKAFLGNLIYKKREQVNIKLVNENNELLDGNFSIAVKRKEPQLFSLMETILTSTKNKIEITTLPDYKGIRVSGFLSDINNAEAVNEEVLLSFPGSGTDLFSARTNELGEFHFLLEPEFGGKDLVFTLPSNKMKLKLEDPFVNGLKSSFNTSIKIDSSAIGFLKEKYFYWQLSQKFDRPEIQKIELVEEVESSIFYSEPRQSYKIDDYILLDSIVEYFHELIPSVHFYRVKKNYEISVIGRKSKIKLGENPGIFVDGVYYTDFDNLAKIPAEEVDRIDVLWENYYYKDFTFNGIVDIRTKKEDFFAVRLQDNMVRVIYPLANRNSMQFKNTEYIENDFSYQPDLRYLLFWEPNVDPKQSKELTFYTSDVSGIYETTISGYSKNGDWLELKNEFEVK
ncbi:MAG: hypothetical protein HQ522_10440 [Bacteroidetes bacterium]|nr:hypothetical protein [Bacteroidota bacterium]